MECLNTGVDVDLFSEAAISIVVDKHHRHPVITRITRNFFRATAMYNIHAFSPVASLKGRYVSAARDKMSIVYLEKKRNATFHLRVFTAAQTTLYSQSQL